MDEDEPESAIGSVVRGRVVLAAREVERVPGPRSRRLPVITPPSEGRPLTRGDCVDAPRPCPWVACRHHLLLDIDPGTGAIYTSFGGADFDEIPQTCALDVADQGGLTLQEVAETVGITRERVRQIESRSQRVLRRMPPALVGGLRELMRHEAPSRDVP